jgi:regulator of protease activity HflC (stomatin/prohibitin superfamily)
MDQDFKAIQSPSSSSSIPAREITQYELSFPSVLSSILCFLTPFSCCNCEVVRERQQVVVLNFGKYVGQLKRPGLYCCVNPCGMSKIPVSTQNLVLDLPTSKILDINGNPVIVSAIITYVVHDPKKAALDVTNTSDYIKTQGLAVLKSVVSRFPYESHDNTPSLKSDVGNISLEMSKELQEKADFAGCTILSFDLTDLSYAPEIASGLLVKQQAQAVVQARYTIVQGAVSIAQNAIEGLEAQGIEFTEDEKSRLVSNLLVTLCSEGRVQPMVTLN